MNFDDLILQLEILRGLLNENAIEAYCGLREHSPFGPKCDYVRGAGKTIISEGNLAEILAQCAALGAYTEDIGQIQQDFLDEESNERIK